MKRCIYADDWNPDRDDPQVSAFIEAMAENIDKQDDPDVGIFWYDPEEDELFGVVSVSVDEAIAQQSSLFDNKIVKTCRKLHYKVWQKEHFRGKDSRFNGDWTQTPRGRVFALDDGTFVVMTGSWIRQYPQVMDYILDEFQLPEDQTKFKIDKHWDLGHGYTDRF